MSDNTYYNIMMFGGRRCGKTSVLASMQSCFEEALKASDVYMGCSDFGTLKILREKYHEIFEFFFDKKAEGFAPESNPTQDITEYNFFIGLNSASEKSKINIKFIDYPGEFLREKKEHERLRNYMETSRILLIAIDTPHLIEETPGNLKVGRFNEAKNMCYDITESIKMTGFASRDKGPGMVLFIPIKCERYFNLNREKTIYEVGVNVKQAYKNLINYLKGGDITIAITPIITMGGAEFSHFERNEEGEIIMDNKYKTPYKAMYCFPDMSVNEPSPQFCEQPMVYILSFILANAARIEIEKKNSRGFFARIRDFFCGPSYDLPLADKYLFQAKLIHCGLWSEGYGYSIIEKGILSDIDHIDDNRIQIKNNSVAIYNKKN